MSSHHPHICGDCGSELEPGRSICSRCGWDLTTAVVQQPRRSLLGLLAAGGWRILLLAVLVSLPVLGFMRLHHTGPAADLPTTLRWIAFGDGGRADELVTIHRMYETGAAASRYALRELGPPPFDGDWESALAPYATMLVRGWMPMLFIGVTTDMAPESVKTFYRVREVDGWGRPYRVSTRLLPRGTDWRNDPVVAEDLSDGLHQSFFTLGRPDFEAADWLRLTMESAGVDGRFDTGDDLRMISYVPVGFTLRVGRDPQQLQRQMDAAFDVGRHYFRIEGSHYDVVDARLLAEFRIDTVS